MGPVCGGEGMGVMTELRKWGGDKLKQVRVGEKRGLDGAERERRDNRRIIWDNRSLIRKHTAMKVI